MPRRIIAAVSAAALAISLSAGAVLAGQPSQDCSLQSSSPNGFNTAGFAKAEAVYANADATGGTASGNGQVVSQYDVACFEVSLNH